MQADRVNIVLIIIVTVIILAVIYFIIRKIFNRFLASKILASSISLAHLKHFENEKKDIEIFFFGACEFNSGIDPRKFQHKAFNFAIQIASYPEQYYFLKRYIDEMNSLKLLVLSVGDNSFCSYAATGVTFPLMFSKFINYKELMSVSKPRMWLKILWYKWLYSTDLGTLHYGRKFFAASFRRFIKQRRIQYGAIKQSFQKKASNTKATSPQEKPSQPNPSVEKTPVIKAKKQVCATAEDGVNGVEKHFTHPLFDERALFYFEKILDLCRERNIPLVAVSMPRSKYFLDIASERDYVTEQMLLDKIINNPKYSSIVCEYLNYLSIYRDRDDLFQAEGALLNADGRREFTQKIAEDIVPIMNTIITKNT